MTSTLLKIFVLVGTLLGLACAFPLNPTNSTVLLEGRDDSNSSSVVTRLYNDNGPVYTDVGHRDGWDDASFNAMLISITDQAEDHIQGRILDSADADAKPVTVDAQKDEVWVSLLGVDGHERTRKHVQRQDTDAGGAGAWWVEAIRYAATHATPAYTSLSLGSISNADPQDVLEMLVGHRGDIFEDISVDVLKYHLRNVITSPIVVATDDGDGAKWESVLRVIAEGTEEKVITYTIDAGEKEYTYGQLAQRVKKFIC